MKDRLDKLSEEDFSRIKSAVATAEKKTSGEIVPVLVNSSYAYPSAKYKFAILSAFATMCLLVAGDRLLTDFDLYDPLYYLTITAIGGLIGFICPILIPQLRVSLIKKSEKKFHCTQHAETLFLEQEVFNTTNRTGIMIYISFLERNVVIMADKEISHKVDQTVWDELVQNLTSFIKSDRLIEGLEKTIHDVGALLVNEGFTKEDNDTNELSDDLIRRS